MPVAELIDAYGLRYDLIRNGTLDAVNRAWHQLAGPDVVRAAEWIDVATPIVEAGQYATAELVDGYMAAVLSELTGDAIAPIGIDPATVTGASVRNGTAQATVLERPVIELRRLLSDGIQYNEAFSQAGGRAANSVETDIALTHRAAARETMTAHGVVGYRRVLTGSSCVRCAIASTQRYRSADLLPIHGRCDCRVAPILGDRDPGRVINKGLLTEMKRSGASADLSLSDAVRRSKDSIKLADTRVAEIRAELTTETDPERIGRLEDRIDSWNDRKREATRTLDKREQQLAEFRSENPGAPKSIAVHEHGELGPVLTDAADHFTGPSDI